MTNQNNDYTPSPVDTTNVQLPEELIALAETKEDIQETKQKIIALKELMKKEG